MLIMSVAAYTGHLPLGESFAWLGTPSALIMLAVAALAEILAYYIPGVDNLLDSVATPAAFIAGTVVSAAVITDLPPMLKWTTAVIAAWRCRRTDAKRNRAAQGEIDPVHRRYGQRSLGHRRAWRVAYRVAPCACGADRRACRGGLVLVGGLSGRQTRCAAPGRIERLEWRDPLLSPKLLPVPGPAWGRFQAQNGSVMEKRSITCVMSPLP